MSRRTDSPALQFHGVSILAALVAVAAQVGCSDSGQGNEGTGPSARFEIVQEGEGPTNEEPLWPMRPGARWDFRQALHPLEPGETFSGEAVIGITRASDRFGKTWLLEQVSGMVGSGSPWSGGLGWNQGREEAYWSMDEEGLVLRAMGTNDLLKTPLLMIPAKVRAGMQWVVNDSDGGQLLAGSISGGDMTETQWGSRRVWLVEVTVAERRPKGSRGTGDNGEPGMVKWSQQFVEGRGPLQATTAVVPLLDQEPSLPKRRPLAALGQEPREYRGRVEGFSVTQDPATGQLVAQMGIHVPSIPPVLVSKIMTGGGSVTNEVYFRDRRVCFRTDGQGLEEIEPPPPGAVPPREWDWKQCQDAAGVVYDDAGHMSARVPFRIDGSAPDDWFYDFGPGIQHRGLSSVGTFLGTSFNVPGAKGLARDQGIISGGVPVLEIHQAGSETTPGWKEAQNPTKEEYMFSLGPWAQQWGLEKIDRAVGLGPESGRKLDILFMGHGVLGHGRLQSIFEPQPVGGIDRWRMVDSGLDFHTYDEFVVVTRADNSRELFQVSEDGLIWRVELKDGALVRSFLTAVDVPDGHQVVGIVPVAEDELQVWTQEGFTWEGQEGIPGVGFVDIYVDDIWQHAWTVKLDGESQPEPPPLAGELFLQASGPDVLVCGPAGTVLPTDGWTLGGEEATVVEIDGRCLLLERPLKDFGGEVPSMDEADLIPRESGAWVIEGSLPDVGPVALVLEPLQPLVPNNLVAAGDGTFTGGEVSQDALAQGGVVRISGPGKAMNEHFWGPYPNSTCSAYAWDLQLWDATQMPDLCTVGITCWGVVRPGATPQESKPFRIPDGKMSLAAPDHPDPLLTVLPDGCPAVKWGTWFYRLDDELGPVEIEDPFATPAPDWALCEELEIDHNGLHPDVDRYSCSLADGTEKTVELPREQLKRVVSLPGNRASYWVTGTYEPYVWWLDQGTWDLRPVKVPNAAHFGAGGLVGLDGYCGLDGTCYLLLVGRSDGKGGAIPWEIVRVDREVSGIHPVYSGWASDLAVPEQIVGDEELLLVTGGAHILWRGLRSLEPSTCDGCSQQEACISGYCDCPFGQVRNDGYCEIDLPLESYRSCKEALAGGVSPGVPVRIDGDGPDWPAPEFVALCSSGGEWTEPPLEFAMASTVGSNTLNGSCQLPGAPGLGWGSPQIVVLSSSAASLHGEFEVVADFGEIFSRPNEDGSSTAKETTLVIDDAELFDPVTGRYAKACGDGDPGPVGEEIRMVYTPLGNMEIAADGQTKVQVDWKPGMKLRLERQADGLIRIFADEAPVWTSSRPYVKHMRLLRMDHGGLTILEARFRGADGALCVPHCEGRECGPDGCDGSCGTCPENGHCSEAGLCECNEPRFLQEGECLFPTGSQEYPAASCEEASEAGVPWFTTPWVDPDGAGGEEPFQMEECAVYSAWNMAGEPWTLSPSYFLGSSAAMVMGSGQGECGVFDASTPAFPWPASANGAFGILDGSVIPAGVAVAATNRYVKGRFMVELSLYAGQNGEHAAVHLDGLDAFDAETAAWTGWAPACGQTVAPVGRLTLKASQEGIWIQLGEAQPILLGPSEFGSVSLTRTAEGDIEVRLNDQVVIHTVPAGTLPDALRIVGEAEGGAGVKVSVARVQWW